MAQVIDHVNIDIDQNESPHDNRTIRSPLRDPNSVQSDAEADPEAGTDTNTNSTRRVSRRWKAATALVSILCVLAVTVGLTVHFVKASMNGTNASAQGGTHHTAGREDGQEDDGDGVVQVSVVPESNNDGEVGSPGFLTVIFERDGSSVFVLDKAHWNHSFIVYPTVVKHSSPAQIGLEHGSTLLDSSDYVFHFERSINPRFLVLVLENHRTRLKSEQDELKQVFEDSQWPGFIAQVAIFMETDDAYHFSSDPFLSTGFYVSSLLVSPYYTPIPAATEFFPRNTNLQVEYELETGILIVNYAIGLLPELQMPQRLADDRLGYFMQRYVQYGVAPSEEELNDGNQYIDESITIINRRWLKRDEDTGDTINPIVYYIDPSVPIRWRQSFADGVMAWSRALEAAGWPNAIRAVLPTDPDWPEDYRIGDLRYNSISVMISDQTYAYGPILVDPRSGEILHSDITFEYGFFNEVMGDFDVVSPISPPTSQSLTDRLAWAVRAHPQSTQPANTHTRHTHLHTQCGLGTSPQQQMDRMLLGLLMTSDPKHATVHVPSEIIGQHFADIVMHEVGHTLGLRHNFAGSASVTRQQLNTTAYTKGHGISTSIMDYLPVNIFSDLSVESASSHTFYQTNVGEYDVAAIIYGYRTVDDELLPSGRLTHSPSLLAIAQSAPSFLTDEDTEGWTNPYSQRFDLSSDPIGYANDRLDLIKKLRATATVDKVEIDASWDNLWRREYAMLRMVNATIPIIQPFLGGVNVTHAHRQAGEQAYRPQFISQQDQLRALKVLARIISAESGLFPSPADYATYIQVIGFSGEDCVAANNDYGCLARGLVDVDKMILDIRKNAIIATLFPALDRIINQDVTSPLKIQQVLDAIHQAAKTDPNVARNQPVVAFFYDVLRYLSRSATEDVRLHIAIQAFSKS